MISMLFLIVAIDGNKVTSIVKEVKNEIELEPFFKKLKGNISWKNVVKNKDCKIVERVD